MLYLDDNHCVDRLLQDFKQHGGLIVAFDFDNTVYDYHNQGLDCSCIIDLLRVLDGMGCTLICYTANEDESFVRGFLEKNGIPHNYINESPVKSGRKIYYNILLDDRAGLRSAYNQLNCFIKRIHQGE